MGASGSGKSASLRNFDPAEIGVFNVASKPLPFRKKLNMINTSDYYKIVAGLQKNNLRCYVIDDSQYLLSFDFFNRRQENNYQKFADFAANFKGLIDCIVQGTSPDTIVYFLHHTEVTDDGRIKAKTVGKMIDNYLTLEGLFSIVLLAETDGKTHWFTTQSDGFTTAKSPMEMFSLKIDNDLKAVDTAIREYYDLGGTEE